MKIENEVKYKIDSLKKIENNLIKIGFILTKKIAQEDFYFSPPHKKFAGTKKYYLRLRKSNNGCSFSYHVVKNNLQTQEWEVQIDKCSVLLKILEYLNFKIDCIVKKRREIYQKEDISITLDKIEHLGSFIEIECMGHFTERKREQFFSVIRKLNLKKENSISGVGYPDLLMKKYD